MSKRSSKRIWFAVLVAALVLGWSAGAAAGSGPTVRASTGGVVELNAALSHGYVPIEQSKRIHARLKIRADEFQAKQRAPMNLALVIDRSGSMRGGKLQQAKRAAHTLVDRLSEKDRLAVVSYGSSVSVPSDSLAVTPHNQERLHRAISSIGSSGGTNLAGGFSKGRQIADRHGTEESVDRVILLSDGKANEGADTPAALGQLAHQGLGDGISTTTMGIGLNYDESIMTAMAEQGSGGHYFIENEERIAEVFRQEFEALASVVARDTRLIVDLGAGVELLGLKGFSHERRAGKLVVQLGAFYSEQQKDILMDLAVSSGTQGEREVLEAGLHFDDVTGEEDRSVHSDATLVAVGTSEEPKLAEVNDSVMRRVEQLNYAENVQQATEAFDEGDRKEAKSIIEKQRKRLEKAGEEYGFSESTVSRKKEELAEMKSKMDRAESSQSTQGKRLMKKSADQNLELMQSSEAF